MLAPSEKHLEDWIVANPLGFGDFVEDGMVPDAYLPDIRIVAKDGWISPFFSKLLARQMRLPDGIPDLVYVDHYSIHVVEIKKGPITADTVAQALRYIHQFREIYYWAAMNLRETVADDWEQYSYKPTLNLEMTEYPEQEISGMVIGSSIETENLAAVCAASGIAAVTYSYEDDWYWFERQPIITKGKMQDFIEYGYGAIGEAMRGIMKNRTKHQREQSQRGEQT